MKLRFYYVSGGIHPQRGQNYLGQEDATGGPDAERYHLYMAASMSAIAQTAADCDRLLSTIDDVENGKRAEVKDGGNDVLLTFKQSGVQVDILVNDDWTGQPEGHFTLQQWKTVLQAWRRFLQLPRSFDSVVEIDV